jgi:hypothetical protein
VTESGRLAKEQIFTSLPDIFFNTEPTEITEIVFVTINAPNRGNL